MRVFALAAISGLLSYLSVSLPHFIGQRQAISDDGLFIMPGVLFGLFVLLPQVQTTQHRVIRWIGLMIISVVAWYIAVIVGFQMLPLSRQSSVISCGISGSAGAFMLAMASRYMVPIEIHIMSVLKAVLAGFLGGCVFGMAIIQPRASAASEGLYLIGFLFWQISVGMSIFSGQRS
jgi:hypothetical protein